MIINNYFLGGAYRCSVSNAGGETSAELRLVVSTPLHVEITPPLLSVHMGGTAEFRLVLSENNLIDSRNYSFMSIINYGKLIN